MNEKKKSHIANILFICIIFSGLLTNDVTYSSNMILRILYIERFKYVIFFLGFLLILFSQKCKLNSLAIYSFTFILIILIEFFNIGQNTIKQIMKYFLLFPVLFFSDVDVLEIKNKVRNGIILFIFFAFYYSYVQGWFMGYSLRMIFNSTDPNISGMYILFAFFLSRKIKSNKLSIILLVMGLLTFSRNFILSILIYYFSIIVLRHKYIKALLLKFNFFSIILIFNIILVVASFTMFNTSNYSKGSGTDMSRLLNLNDESNSIRFRINRDVINSLTSSFSNLLYGFGPDYPSNKDIDIGYKSHNGFLDYMMMNGILYAIFTLVLIYFSISNKKNFEYIMSYAVFSLFLPGLFAGVYIFIFILITKINSIKKSV